MSAELNTFTERWIRKHGRSNPPGDSAHKMIQDAAADGILARSNDEDDWIEVGKRFGLEGPELLNFLEDVAAWLE